MTFPEPEFEEEFWDQPALFPRLLEKLVELGDRTADLHAFLFGPGGDWNGTGDLVC